MAILKLQAPVKDYLWGGRRLIDEFHKTASGEIAAESWELSCYPGSSSVIINGEYQGMELPEYLSKFGKAMLGTNCRDFEDFPVLIKFIDAKQDLSIQVHPTDEYALINEKQYGKTEMWYVLDAEEDAFLYYGFKQEVTKEEFKQRIEQQTLTEVLNAVPVQKGDVLFIEAGTLHAIGKGILIAEIQQNSNVTYRVYDYGRKDKDGRLRDLHIEKALAVTERIPVKRVKSTDPHVAECPYFTVDKINLSGHLTDKLCGFIGEETFAHILVLEGEGRIKSGRDDLHFRKGDSFFIPAGSGDFEIAGHCEALMTSESSAAAGSGLKAISA